MMESSAGLGRALIVLGIAIAVVGVIVLYSDRMPFLKSLGRLPGDINLKGDNWQFSAPLATSLLFSILMTAAFWIYSHFSNRGGR